METPATRPLSTPPTEAILTGSDHIPPDVDAGTTLRDHLRALTHAAHARLNQLPRLAALARGDCGLVEYGQILRDYHRLYAGLDPCLGASAGYVPRLPWLDADLDCLKQTLAPPLAFVCPPDDAARIGLRYVVEGSSLGGAVIAARVRDTLGLDAARGARFFHGHGDQTGPRWQSFLAFAERACADTDQRERAGRAAAGLFERFEAVLTGAIPE